ncbi:MAG TPA: DUF559 domain-containing protein [Spirochaetota bacterium]|nr:DUF559 domain-containing protein [Spirochaetota bacterium]
MTIAQYIDSIDKRYKLGNSTEHTFRGDLQNLLETLAPEIQATNEPKRQRCGAPDYIITKKDIPIGFIEAKDIGDGDLDGIKKAGNKEQFDRYKASLNNLIFTDYLNFHLYRDGEFVTKISIAEITDKGIKPLPENFASFENLIKDFCSHIGQTIKSSKKLAEMMAGKARLLSDIIGKALTSDEDNDENSTLKDQMLAFKQVLIHDITPKGFADVYAQTITYGMFAARLRDPTLKTFSRQEAAELIPKSNPFLRSLFGYIAGPDIDDRIKWIVDSLADIFLACNVEEILKNFGKATQMEDPIIHFYEDFLSEYDPALRKARGVWYTPKPVVNFIVRAVDDILKTEFNLPQGLADTSKTKIKVEQQGAKGKFEKEFHTVQILDPATGTGTFLTEAIKQIYKKFEGQQGIWSNYVETHLLPRLNGFELLMASYAMAHLKLDLLLSELTSPPFGRPSKGGAGGGQRLRVYLTNSLEEYHPDTGTLFANWLSAEANEANHIKRDTPVMCVIGNPPYSVSSANKGEWIESLVADYKKDLNERNIQPLSDDYIKFIRYGQHFIEKNGAGILAYISNNSFIDGLIHRQMRKDLLKTFDKIYILDLHGNAKKKEIAPDGSPDQNVFDIMQGVSINIFVKTDAKKKNELGKVFHFDLFGKRDFKYDFLNKNSINALKWNELENAEPNYFFVLKDFEGQEEYEKGFKVDELFKINTSGIKTHNDSELVSFEPFLENNFVYDYRPFDIRFINYDLSKVVRARYSVMKHFIQGENVGLILMRKQQNIPDFKTVLLSKSLSDINFYGFQTYAFPLYLYPETIDQQAIGDTVERTPNLNLEIVNQIAEKLGLTFTTSPTPPGEGLNSSTLRRGYETANPKHYTLIKDLRDSLKKNPTEAEKIMWEYLRNKKTGYKIRRQHIIDDFIVDFVCLSKKVVIEIDGEIHLKQKEKDELRTERLNELGYDVIRFTNEEVFADPQLVFSRIKEVLDNKPDLQTNSITPPLEGTGEVFAPIDLLDYIYAVLHSPTYRETYKEFLKIDFPRVPYPKDKNTFWKLVKLGGEIRKIHLMESPVVENFITQYPIDGDNVVDNPTYKDNKVYINKTQYFDNVPQVAWEFYIGGYQPAQKWLKDRRGRKLDFEDILHYQKIIVALVETDRLMGEVDGVGFLINREDH